MITKIKLVAALIVLATLASGIWYFTNKYNTYKSSASQYKLLNEQSTKKIGELNSVIASKEKTISDLSIEIQVVSDSISAYSKRIDAVNTAMQKIVTDRAKKERELDRVRREFFINNPTLVDDKATIDEFLKMGSEIRIDSIHSHYCTLTDKCTK